MKGIGRIYEILGTVLTGGVVHVYTTKFNTKIYLTNGALVIFVYCIHRWKSRML